RFERHIAVPGVDNLRQLFLALRRELLLFFVVEFAPVGVVEAGFGQRRPRWRFVGMLASALFGFRDLFAVAGGGGVFFAPEDGFEGTAATTATGADPKRKKADQEQKHQADVDDSHRAAPAASSQVEQHQPAKSGSM